ncbi:MAG: alpha/beta fold hydrolase [SAR324 cluster bacterium]|nr:alpha/beta fold hydrolase [SAR324 cluster bacterium]
MILKPTKYSIGDLQLESGEVIRNAFVSAAIIGKKPLKEGRAVLCCASIAGNHRRLEFLMGPGCALDPDQYCIIATDALGNGWSSSPSNSREQPGIKFPRFTLKDMIASQHRLLEVLGLQELYCVIGASMGGMQALQWTASHRDAVKRVVAMTPQARTSAWSQLANALSREILMSDPNWQRGFVREEIWRMWGGLMMGIIPGTPESVQRSIPSFKDAGELLRDFQLQAQNRKIDPRDWVWQTFAYDAHDLADTENRLSAEEVLHSIEIPALIIGAPGDLYNPTEEARKSAALLSNGLYREIPSFLGHAAASDRRAEDADFLNRVISDFLSD